MAKTILGRKIGMTQIYTERGDRVPVTVVKVGPCTVLEKKTVDGKDGYAAIKVGFDPAKKIEHDGDIRYRGMNKPKLGYFEKIGVEPFRVVREFRVGDSEADDYEVKQELDHTLFDKGDYVDVTGRSKGRGFAGVMKRHGFAGFKASHGVHESFRGAGSIGASATPSRVFKGKRMAGRMGNDRVTILNLQIVEIDEEEGLYLIKGAIPGTRDALVSIRKAVKKN